MQDVQEDLRRVDNMSGSGFLRKIEKSLPFHFYFDELQWFENQLKCNFEKERCGYDARCATASRNDIGRRTLGHQKIRLHRLRLGSAILILLVILVANPIFHLFKESFFVSDDEAGGFTFKNYIDAFETTEYYKPMYITMMLAVSVGSISLVVGSRDGLGGQPHGYPFPEFD